VGRHRGAGVGGGHDEREQTLNQILSEMDGFTQNESVIVMAPPTPRRARSGLASPGAFRPPHHRRSPTLKGRLAIFEVHSKDVPLDIDVDLERLAAGSVGLTGADIRNLVNEAALWQPTRQDYLIFRFEYARDRVLMGAKREDVLSGKEKSMTAYTSRATPCWPGWYRIDRVHKVSIIPRGRSLGATQLLARGRPLQHQRERIAHPAAVSARRRAAEKSSSTSSAPAPRTT